MAEARNPEDRLNIIERVMAIEEALTFGNHLTEVQRERLMGEIER